MFVRLSVPLSLSVRSAHAMELGLASCLWQDQHAMLSRYLWHRGCCSTCTSTAQTPAPLTHTHTITHTYTLFARVCESEMPELKSHFKSSSPCPTTLVVCLVWPSAHDSQSQSPQISNNKSHNYGAAAVQLQVQVQELE